MIRLRLCKIKIKLNIKIESRYSQLNAQCLRGEGPYRRSPWKEELLTRRWSGTGKGWPSLNVHIRWKNKRQWVRRFLLGELFSLAYLLNLCLLVFVLLQVCWHFLHFHFCQQAVAQGNQMDCILFQTYFNISNANLEQQWCTLVPKIKFLLPKPNPAVQ